MDPHGQTQLNQRGGAVSENPTKVRAATPIQLPQASHDEILLRRYRVLERRGRGGFGTVCACWDTRLQRRVAIKRLPLAEWGTTAEEALAEARTACMLSHPNIVTVYDFETDDTFAYLVMEYVDGLNLAELLARVEGGRLTPEECAQVLCSVADALGFAHENRVLHLDIKPTNIMVDRKGTVKLADFGMSTLASAAGYGGARGGTVGYMPPEQVRGEMVDERTDVFALAAVVWQALTGANPFLARSAEDSQKRIERGPGRLQRDCPGLDPAVEQALLAALAPSPALRTADVTELSDEIVPWLGSPQEGASSLQDLVSQAEDDEGDSVDIRRPEDGRVRRRLPEGVLARAATALVCFSALRLLAPFALPEEASAAAVGIPLLCAFASAVWPPLASLLVGGSLVAALALRAPDGSAAMAVAAGALAVVLVIWWALAGRKDRLTSVCLLLPSCLPSPASACAPSAYALDPLPAAATTAAGYLMGTLYRGAVAGAFSPGAMVSALVAEAADPSFWLLLIGSALSSALASSVALRGSVAAGLGGQALGFAGVFASCVLAASVKNSGIWGVLDWSTVVLALLLGVLMCIATVLRGPLYEDQEGEDLDEFSE